MLAATTELALPSSSPLCLNLLDSRRMEETEVALGTPLIESARSTVLGYTEVLLQEFEHEQGIPSLERLIQLNDEVATRLGPVIEMVTRKLSPPVQSDQTGAPYLNRNRYLIVLADHLYEGLDTLRALSQECRASNQRLSEIGSRSIPRGDAWRRAVKAIRQDFANLGLPVGVGKDPDNSQSRFADFIHEWQTLLPEDVRRGTSHATAPRTEIRRAFRSSSHPPWVAHASKGVGRTRVRLKKSISAAGGDSEPDGKTQGNDDTTELTPNAILRWVDDSLAVWHYIAPGKPLKAL